MGWMDRIAIEQGDAVHTCADGWEVYTFGINVCPDCGQKLTRSAKLARQLARRESRMYAMYDEQVRVEPEGYRR